MMAAGQLMGGLAVDEAGESMRGNSGVQKGEHAFPGKRPRWGELKFE